MQVLKVKRVKDKEAIKSARKSICEVCEEASYGGAHHVTPVSCGGPDIKENLIQLCWKCHVPKAHSGHYSKRFLYGIIAEREGKTVEEIEEIVRMTIRTGVKPE